ncbi:MAG TPA: serine hydrolase [Pseudacidobacterium sp.]|nr:serine hydrolase [Pseudacidobacterium sp.]
MNKPSLWIVLALCLLAFHPIHAQEDTALEAQLRALTALHHGKVAIYAKDLNSGKTIAINADTPVPTASVIKLTVLFEALKQIQAGKAHFEDRVRLTKENQVEGSGVLGFFDTPQTLTLKDILTMMIVVSDNTATNVAIDKLGLKNIDERIQWLGLKDTWLYKKVAKPAVGPMPPDQKQFGLGKTTAREMAEVMERFDTCNLNAPGRTANSKGRDQKLCDAAMHMLRNQFYRNSIPRYLETIDTTEGESKIANKTGALDHVRNDVGVVDAKNGPVILSEFTWDNQDTSWTPDNSAEVLMAKAAKIIVDRWQ